MLAAAAQNGWALEHASQELGAIRFLKDLTPGFLKSLVGIGNLGWSFEGCFRSPCLMLCHVMFSRSLMARTLTSRQPLQALVWQILLELSDTLVSRGNDECCEIDASTDIGVEFVNVETHVET